MLSSESTSMHAHHGNIRRATRADITAIAHLMRRAQTDDGVPRISEDEIAELMLCGELIVLDDEIGEVVAAACLTTAGGRGNLAFLVVDPDAASEHDRLVEVTAALSESARCTPSFACRSRGQR